MEKLSDFPKSIQELSEGSIQNFDSGPVLSEAHQHCDFLMVEKGPCVVPTCHLLSGLSKGEGIRWKLSTEHLLISIEHLISSCCFVKSSDKKRNPFLFIFSWETLSPFLLFNETCFLMRNLI